MGGGAGVGAGRLLPSHGMVVEPRVVVWWLFMFVLWVCCRKLGSLCGAGRLPWKRQAKPLLSREARAAGCRLPRQTSVHANEYFLAPCDAGSPSEDLAAARRSTFLR